MYSKPVMTTTRWIMILIWAMVPALLINRVGPVIHFGSSIALRPELIASLAFLSGFLINLIIVKYISSERVKTCVTLLATIICLIATIAYLWLLILNTTWVTYETGFSFYPKGSVFSEQGEQLLEEFKNEYRREPTSVELLQKAKYEPRELYAPEDIYNIQNVFWFIMVTGFLSFGLALGLWAFGKPIYDDQEPTEVIK